MILKKLFPNNRINICWTYFYWYLSTYFRISDSTILRRFDSQSSKLKMFSNFLRAILIYYVSVVRTGGFRTVADSNHPSSPWWTPSFEMQCTTWLSTAGGYLADGEELTNSVHQRNQQKGNRYKRWAFVIPELTFMWLVQHKFIMPKLNDYAHSWFARMPSKRQLQIICKFVNRSNDQVRNYRWFVVGVFIFSFHSSSEVCVTDWSWHVST